ncbi:MAG: OmpA family protein [Ferruginibacter sp.]
MKHVMFVCLLATQMVVFAQKDKPGCENVEPKYMTRMPGFYISNCEKSEFNTYKFSFINLKDKREYKEVSGKFYKISYDKDPTETRIFSGKQILANYHNAVVKAKGESLALNKVFFKMKQEGKNIYFQIDNAVDSDDRGFELFIIEEESMKQDVEVNMSEEIDANGKIALYGILFDVNKATIKPESATALQVVIDYLTANPVVKIIVVGHTDNTGVFAKNLVLSKDRAKSVKDYLVSKGKIAADRLLSDGVASLCPVSTNETDAGKQLNRRVEIVKQ